MAKPTPSTNWSMSVRRWWLRIMKEYVRKTSRLHNTAPLALRVLAVLPSGWTARVALAKRARERGSFSQAKEIASWAITSNPVVWQPHQERISALVDSSENSSIAKAVALGLMTENSLKAFLGKWGVGDSLSREAALKSLQLTPQDLIRAFQEVRELAGHRATRAYTAFIDAYGTDWALEVSEDVVDIGPDAGIVVFERMRSDGGVTGPHRFLSQFGDSDQITRTLVGVEQDIKALNRELDLRLPSSSRRYNPRKDTSLYLLHNSLPHKSGGYSTRSDGLIRGLRTNGVQAVPVTRPGFPSEKYVFDQIAGTRSVESVEGIDYHRLLGKVGPQPRSNLQGFMDFYADLLQPLVKEFQPSIMHAASNWWNGYAASAAGRRHGVPTVYEIRGLWEVTRASRQESWADSERFEVDAAYERGAADLADRVICITGGLRDEMVRRGVDESKITLVPNAVNVEQFSPIPRDASLLNSLGLDGRCVIGFAGTITFYEGLDDLLRAGSSLRHSTETPFNFLFVGDGPARSDLERLADELGLADVCHFVGRVPHEEVRRYLSVMDITPFPRVPIPVCEMVSPLKPLESMAMRVSVIASDVQALKEMVPEGTGLTFSKGDVGSLTETLAVLIDDPSLRQELATNAEEWVRAERSWPKVSSLVAEIYHELGG